MRRVSGVPLKESAAPLDEWGEAGLKCPSRPEGLRVRVGCQVVGGTEYRCSRRMVVTVDVVLDLTSSLTFSGAFTGPLPD